MPQKSVVRCSCTKLRDRYAEDTQMQTTTPRRGALERIRSAARPEAKGKVVWLHIAISAAVQDASSEFMMIGDTRATNELLVHGLNC